MKWKAGVAVCLGLSLGACGSSPSHSAGQNQKHEFCQLYTTGVRYTLADFVQLRFTSPNPTVRSLAKRYLDASAHLTQGLSIHREAVLVDNAKLLDLQTQPVQQASAAVDSWVTHNC